MYEWKEIGRERDIQEKKIGRERDKQKKELTEKVM